MRTKIYKKFYTGISQNDRYMRDGEVSYAENIDLQKSVNYVKKYSAEQDFITTNGNSINTSIIIENAYGVSKVLFGGENGEIYTNSSTDDTPTWTSGTQALLKSETFNGDVVFLGGETNGGFEINYLKQSDAVNSSGIFENQSFTGKESVSTYNYSLSKISGDFLIVGSGTNVYFLTKNLIDTPYQYTLDGYVYIGENIKNVFTINDTIVVYTTNRRISFKYTSPTNIGEEVRVSKYIIELNQIIDRQHTFNGFEYVIYNNNKGFGYFNGKGITGIRYKTYNSLYNKFDYSIGYENGQNMWGNTEQMYLVTKNPNYEYGVDNRYDFISTFGAETFGFPKGFNNIVANENGYIKNIIEYYGVLYYSYTQPTVGIKKINLLTNVGIEQTEGFLVTQDFYGNTLEEEVSEKELKEIEVDGEFSEAYISTFVDGVWQDNEIRIENGSDSGKYRFNTQFATTFKSIAIKIRIVGDGDKLNSITIKYDETTRQ